MRYYIYHQSGQEQGPRELDAIREMYKNEEIDKETLVRPEGSKEWMLVDQVLSGRQVSASDSSSDSAKSIAAANRDSASDKKIIWTMAWAAFALGVVIFAGEVYSRIQPKGMVESEEQMEAVYKQMWERALQEEALHKEWRERVTRNREIERKREEAARGASAEWEEIRKAEEEKRRSDERAQTHGVPRALKLVQNSLNMRAGHTIDEFLKMVEWDDPVTVQRAIEEAIQEAEDQYVAQYPDNPNAREDFRKMRAEDKIRRYRMAQDDPEFVKMKEGKPFEDGWRAFSFWMPLEYSARASTENKSPDETIPMLVNIIEESEAPKAVAQDSATVEPSVTKAALIAKQQTYNSADWGWGDILRVVEDPDGHTNVRSGQSTKSQVVAQVASGSVVAIDPKSQGGWARLIDGRDMGDEKFYIHSSRLREITGWTHDVIESMPPNATAARIKMPDIEVLLESRPFDSTTHKVHKFPDGTLLVDEIKPWGVDGGLPSSEFTLNVVFEGENIRLPDSAFSDLFEANEDTLSIIRNPRDSGHFLVVMTNSDGAGAYYVAWAFKGRQYVGRSVIEGYAPEIN